MTAFRRLAKHAVEAVLGSGPIVAAGLTARRHSRLILAYHNIVDRGTQPADGDRSLHLPLSAFRGQLDALEDLGLQVVPLHDRPPRRHKGACVCITFDDAYAGAIRHAIPELGRRGWPTTLFVAPGLLGSAAPWWDRLAEPESGSVPHALREHMLTAQRGDGDTVIAEAQRRGIRLTPPAAEHRIATEAELIGAVDVHPGLTLGAHTWSHPNLAALALADPERLMEELAHPHHWLRERFSLRYTPYLAYPYGLESADVRKAAAATGFSHALRVEGGWDDGTAGAFQIPRLNVASGLSIMGFRARIAALIR